MIVIARSPSLTGFHWRGLVIARRSENVIARRSDSVIARREAPKQSRLFLKKISLDCFGASRLAMTFSLRLAKTLLLRVWQRRSFVRRNDETLSNTRQITFFLQPFLPIPRPFFSKQHIHDLICFYLIIQR